MIPKLEPGPFVGFPDLFRNERHALIVESPEGMRCVHDIFTVSHGPNEAVVGSIPAGRVLLRIAGNIFVDQHFVPWNLIVECDGHVWRPRLTAGYRWEACERCNAGRRP